MTKIEDVAAAALSGDALLARSRAQDFLRETADFQTVERPSTTDAYLLTTSAALIELFAERQGKEAPKWTAHVGPVETPLFLLHAAATMKRLRALCETEAPTPLRKRRLYAPPDYLDLM